MVSIQLSCQPLTTQFRHEEFTHVAVIQIQMGQLQSSNRQLGFIVKTNLFLLPQQCNIQLNRKMMSELAIHEPRSFKVCLQLCTERKELRKGARNEGGGGGDRGKQGYRQKKEWEGARKQVGMHGESKGDRKAGRAGRRETDPCRQTGMNEMVGEKGGKQRKENKQRETKERR